MATRALLHSPRAGTYSEPEARVIISQLAQAIRACHRQGVIHGDIKPENIICKHEQDMHIKLIGECTPPPSPTAA